MIKDKTRKRPDMIGNQFAKGKPPNKTSFKKGNHYSFKTEFKRGQPKLKNAYSFEKGNKNPHWKGGKYKSKNEYIFIYKPTHPFCDKRGYVREHRLIVEQQIGRYLIPEETPHHLGTKDDNRPHMLMAFINKGVHNKFHKNPSLIKPSEIIFDGRKH